MDNWVSIERFSEIRGLTPGTIYSHISRTRNTDKDHSKKYKKDGKNRLINLSWFLDQDKHKGSIDDRFHAAYYELLEILGNQNQIAKHISKKMMITPHAAYMYLRDCFISNIAAVTERRVQYLTVMESLIKEMKAKQ